MAVENMSVELQEKFLESYERLNPKQKQAVDHYEGPVMVIAGPGTGKTQILAVRIGKILHATDAQPKNILCLTYTDAGVIAMRKRLLSLIGSDAHRINIHTFHSFCNEVIQENRNIFSFSSEHPATDLDQSKVMMSIIDNWENHHPLKKFKDNNRYDIRHKLLHLFSTIKKEKFDPKKLASDIQVYIDNMPDNEKYKKKRGDGLKAIYKKDKKKFEELIVGIKEFENYTKRMEEQGLYDFDDMIFRVNKIFKEDKDILASYQERFLYVLVDEFQDTSGAQYELIRQLISYWDVPNVFVVGDNDQSIYRFQGASLYNFSHFSNTVSNDLQSIVLNHNYRSRQAILDAAHSVICQAESKQNIIAEKHLIAENNTAEKFSAVNIKAFENFEHELTFLTEDINEKISRGIAANNIAVLFRKNDIGEEISRYFLKKNIPHSIRKKKNALEHPFGNAILNILKYIHLQNKMPLQQEGDALLSKILYYHFWGLQPIEIGKHIHAFRTWKAKNRSKTLSLRESIMDSSPLYPQNLLFGENKIIQIANKLEHLIALPFNTNIQGLFTAIIQTCNFYEYVMRHSESALFMNILTAYINFIKSESEKNKNLDLPTLLSLLEEMKKLNISLDIYEQIASPIGVHLITNHSSKGLEFDYVYMVACNSDRWEKQRGSNRQFAFPPIITNEDENETVEENRRLFYVSMTRAKKELNIFYSEKKSDTKGREPSVFVTELTQDKYVVDHPTVEQETLIHYALSSPPQKEEQTDTWFDKELIKNYLENDTLSASKLGAYLECPVQFYFRYIVRIPTFANEAMAFGNVVHNVLFDFFSQYRDTKILPDVAALYQFFEKRFSEYRQYFSKQSKKDLAHHGKTIVENYYHHYKNLFNPITALEYSVGPLNYKGINIEGRLDKIEFDGNNGHVIDYKTGKYKPAAFRPPDDKNPKGGGFWRQAVFYQILMDEQNKKDWKIQDINFDFIDEREEKNRRITKAITKEDKDRLWELVENMYHQIRQHQFNGCNACEWCNILP